MTNSKLVLALGLSTVEFVLTINAIVELLGQLAVLQ
jgi:hypothetical protein